jgi:hypothetical protein
MPARPLAKTIFLHIGTQKTGTTTLQALGTRNRTALAAQGVLYPLTLGKQNHVGLTFFAQNGVGNRDLSRAEGINTQADMQAYVEGLPAALHDEIAHSGCQTVWLSNEHLSSRVRQPAQIARVAALLKPLAEEIRLVVYLRYQPEYYLSTYAMEVKAGGNKDNQPPLNGRDYYYNYDRMLAGWAREFGDDSILVRVFERAALKNGDVVDDFFDVMGFVPGPGIEIPPALNTSLDAKVLQFLRLFRRHIPRFVDDAANPEHGDILRALEGISNGPRFSVPAQTMQQIGTAFAESNASVARRYLGRADGVLFKPVTYNTETASAPLSVEQAVEIAAHLWRFKQHQIAELKGKRKDKPAPAPG